MDFSKFTNDNFDAKEWINDVFQNSEAQNNKEQFASTLVMKLQLLIQEVAKSLEDTSQQIVQTLPKLNREIAVMQQEANLLKNKMLSFEQDVERVEHDTSSTMDGLLALDEAKGRMLEVEKALKEVDNWATLTKDVDSIFQSGSVNVISDRLFNMQQSLKVLGQKVSDYQERHDFLERLKDQFTVAVSPSVVSALTAQNLDSAQYFSKIFARLERTVDLEKYCHKIVKVEISKKWQECIDNEDLTEPDVLMNNFYDSLLSLWFDKLKWFSTIVKNPHLLLCESLQKSLVALDPTVESILKNRLTSDQKDKNEPVSVLIQCKQSVDNISRSLESNILGQQRALASEIQSIAFGPSSLFAEFYRPFLFFVKNYQKYEQSYLLQRLNKLNMGKCGDSAWSIDRFTMSVDFVSADCSEALERCQLFTHNLALPSLLRALEVLFDNYFVILNRSLDSMRQAAMSDGKYLDADNWSQFESLLKLTSFCGNLAMSLQKVKNAVENITTALEEKYSKEIDNFVDIENSRPSANNHFDIILLNSDKLKSALQQHFANSNDSAEYVFVQTMRNLGNFCQQVDRFVCDLLLSPTKLILAGVPKLTAWSSTSLGESLDENLPSFSLAPQEYITKVGQYVMNFAHQLEPYMAQENTTLKFFLNSLHADFPEVETSEQVVRHWLKSMASGVTQQYLESILNIKTLSSAGIRRLKADIDYLRNVLDDLGLEFDKELSAFFHTLTDSQQGPQLEGDETDVKLSLRFSDVLKEMKKSRGK